jgi:hypothetical protein
LRSSAVGAAEGGRNEETESPKTKDKDKDKNMISDNIINENK